MRTYCQNKWRTSRLWFLASLDLRRRPRPRIFIVMSQKEMVLEAIKELPDDASVRDIADRLEFLAAIQTGLDQLDRGEGIPHEEVKSSWPHGLQINLVGKQT